MNPLEAVDVLAAHLREAGVHVVRDDQGDLSGESRSHAAILDAFCAMARIPADEPVEHNGTTCRVGDDPDCDVVLHESGLGDERDRYVVWLTRQFTFEDPRGEYAGMNALTVELVADEIPDGRVPQAQRWGYAGRKRPVSDDAHSELANYAGYVDTWQAAIQRSNSWKVFDELPMSRFRAVQSDI